MAALVLLPGLLNDHRLWSRQCADLADRAEVMVADLTQDDSLPSMARRVLAQAPPHFYLAGLSMGGYVALEILRQAAERVLGLAMVDSSPLPDSPEQSERRIGAIRVTRQGGFDKIMPTMLPNLLHPDHLARPEIAGLVRDMAQAVGPEAFVRQQTAIRLRPDSRPFLPHIACRTLVVVGRQDMLTPPPVAAQMADAIPGARLVVIEQCGHLSAIEQPQAVSSALSDWLSG